MFDLRADEIREALADYASATRVPKWVEPLAAAARSWLTPDIEAAADGPEIRELREALEQHDEVDGSCPLPLWAHVCVAAARAYLIGLEQKPDIEAAAKWMHKQWVIDVGLDPDDPEDTYYPELWDEMEDEDREWYRTFAAGGLVAALSGFQPQPDKETPDV